MFAKLVSRRIALSGVGIIAILATVIGLAYQPQFNPVATTDSTTQTNSTTSTTTTTTRTTTNIQLTNVTVHFIDVGQGDAIFIDTGDKDVLIDGGIKSKGVVVVDYLAGLGITELDYLVATHADSDHIGGLISIIRGFNSLGYPIHTVLDNGQEKTTDTYEQYKSEAEGIGISVGERGQIFQLDTMTEMIVLNPTQPLEFSDHNENSIVVMIRFNAVSFLLTGDLEASGEESVIGAGVNVSATILKIGHHGSRSSTTDTFLSAVNPNVAIISVGEGNRYGHPHQETLDRLVTFGVDVYRTDQHGTIAVTTDGVSYSISTESILEPTPAVVINEVELNPADQDSGNEWVELHNPAGQSVDLSGWTFQTTHGTIGSYVIPQGTVIGADGYLVITFPGQFLDNSDESVILFDNLGEEVDRTPVLADSGNDNKTWQRPQEGSEDWINKAATKGIAN